MKVIKTNDVNYGLNSDSVFRLIESVFGIDYKIKKNDEIFLGDEFWFTDQKLLSIRIQDFIRDSRNNQTKLELRKYEGRRLDRWEYFHNKNRLELKLDQYTDFHMFHQDLFENWEIIKRVLSYIFRRDNTELVDVFDKFFLEYSQIKEANSR